MAYRGPTSTWPYIALGPPGLDSLAPDFIHCHPFYGTGIIRSQCLRAAGRLPFGYTHVPYSRSPPDRQASPYFVPVDLEEGNCQVTIDLADPHNRILDNAYAATPNDFRDLASRIINTCMTHSGFGGYGTLAISNMIDFLANQSTTDHGITGVPWPIGAMYFVVTITSKDLEQFDPAFHDEAVAVLLADQVNQKGYSARANELAIQADDMKRSILRGDQTPWYEVFSSGSSTLLAEMAYTCDADLGAPSASDCNQLAYSGLGPPSDTITVGPGSGTKTMTFNTCNVVITALTSIVLTWSQVQDGLQTLIDSCVQHPLLGARGGRAYPTVPSPPGGKNTKEKRSSPVTGLNALPPGVILTVHSGLSWPYTNDPEMGLQRCTAKRSVATTLGAGSCFKAI